MTRISIDGGKSGQRNVDFRINAASAAIYFCWKWKDNSALHCMYMYTVTDFTLTLSTLSSKYVYDVVTCNFDDCENSCR